MRKSAILKILGHLWVTISVRVSCIIVIVERLFFIFLDGEVSSAYFSLVITLIVKEKLIDKGRIFIGFFLSMILFFWSFHAMLQSGAQMIPYRSIL